MLLPATFYQHQDVVHIARALLGKVLVTQVDGLVTEAIIVETEAYRGADDRACHAYLRKRTARTETMFLPGGHAYVYLCYGIHHLFNVVTHVENEPDAVLIRAVQPKSGIETMLIRRKMSQLTVKLTQGPGCVSQAMGINKSLNASSLLGQDCIWIEDRGPVLETFSINTTTRVGVGYAGADAWLPWRFYVAGNPWVSAYPK